VNRDERSRVLIADDDDGYRALLRVRLAAFEEPVEIAEACDGREAIEQALAHPPRVALLDVAMPNRDGFEAALAIRDALPRTRIYLHTGEYTETQRSRAATLGLEIFDKLELDETLALVASVAAHGHDATRPRRA
jgi:DNA-binding NarL/FixJ family response regulator